MRNLILAIVLAAGCAHAKPRPAPTHPAPPPPPEYVDANDAKAGLSAYHDLVRAQALWQIVKAQLERQYQINIDAGDGFDPVTLKVRRSPPPAAKDKK